MPRPRLAAGALARALNLSAESLIAFTRALQQLQSRLDDPVAIEVVENYGADLPDRFDSTTRAIAAHIALECNAAGRQRVAGTVCCTATPFGRVGVEFCG